VTQRANGLQNTVRISTYKVSSPFSTFMLSVSIDYLEWCHEFCHSQVFSEVEVLECILAKLDSEQLGSKVATGHATTEIK
jgi:hypothetical protein